MKKAISGHIAAHLVAYVRGRGGDVARVARQAGLSLSDLSQTGRWFDDAEISRFLDAVQRLYPEWNAAREAGRTLLSSGLAELRDAGLVFRESPLRLLLLFAERYGEFHRSVSLRIEERSPRRVRIEVRFANREEISQELEEMIVGVVESVPALVELRRYRLRRRTSAVPAVNLRRLGPRMVRVTAEGEVLEYPLGSATGRQGAKVVGRLAADGTFVHQGTVYGVPTSVFELSWRRPLFLGRPTGFSARERAAHLADRLARALELIAASSRRIAAVEHELSEARRLEDAIGRFVTEAKSVTSLHELMSLATMHCCTGFGVDRAAIFVVRASNLEALSFYDPSDLEDAQRVFARFAAQAIPIDGHTLEAEVVRSGRAMAINDPWKNARVDPVLREAWGTKAYAILPIFGRDRVIGVLLADYYHQGRKVTREDVGRLLLCASVVGLAMEKVTAIAALEEKVEERTKALQAAHKKMSALYQQAREAERAKGHYLASMSHELRTPLNSIIGFSKVLLRGIDGELNDAQRQDLTAIHQSGVHLLDLITDILDLSKIEAGKMELRKEHFDPNEVVRDVLETAAVLAQEKSLTLRQDLDNNLPFLYADKMRIRQILMNLVSNAVKFTDSGSITVQTRWQEPDVYFGVIDTGRGMRPEDVERAFKEFHQLGTSPGGREGGSGLGLTICRRFVEMHEGRIWVSSTPGVGSTFHVTIPAPR